METIKNGSKVSAKEGSISSHSHHHRSVDTSPRESRKVSHNMRDTCPTYLLHDINWTDPTIDLQLHQRNEYPDQVSAVIIVLHREMNH